MDKFKVNDKVVIIEDIYDQYEADWLHIEAGTEGVVTFKEDDPYAYNHYYVGLRYEDGELDTYSITEGQLELVGTTEARQAMYRYYESKELRSVWISSRQSMIIASDMMDKARQDLKERGEWDE